MTREKLIEHFAGIATEVFPLYYRADSCLNATRVAVDVFKRLRVPVYPLVTRVLVLNAGMHEKVKEHGRLAESVEERQSWYAENGAHSMGVGFGGEERDDGWPGHLVAVVGGRWMVDGSARQMVRRNHGILLPDVLVDEVNGDFVSGALAHQIEKGGTHLYYKAFPDDKSFMQVSGYASPVNTRVASEILGKMKRLL